jgi:glycosyltransferase involved in cell wall biosynthesis
LKKYYMNGMRKYSMRKIVYISDFNVGGADSAERAVPRSGYANIGFELCRRLTNFGHDVKVLGLGYTGQEHFEKFSIIPCNSLQDVVGYANNLKFLWGVDAVIVAMDIHNYQESLFPQIKQMGLKYVCITPLESDPLCITWANLLREMDKVFFISQFGADEAIKAGVDAEHIEIGIDTQGWRQRTKEEYVAIRKNLGYGEDDFVVLTVADNQERKGLGRGFQIVAELKKLHGVKAKHVLVTREHSMVGWKLYDLAYEIGISSDLRVFQSGMPFAELYMLYCAADAYLCCSKGEGLGLPIMEAMSVGVPVAANMTGAIPELLADDRGWIVPWASWYYDPFGNQKRYDISVDYATQALLHIKQNPSVVEERVERAREFMEDKDWNKSAKQIETALNKLLENGL